MKALKIIGILAAVGIFSLLFSTITGLYACLLQLIVGLPCPACGMSRAVFSFLQGDFRGSFQAHPLMLSLVIVPLLAVEVADAQKQRLLRKIQKGVAIALVCAFILTYIIRMIYLFPHTEPMMPNENARLFKGLRQVFEIPPVS